MPFQAANSSRTWEPPLTSIYIISGDINACEAATSGKMSESTRVKASSRGLIRQLTSKLARRRWQDAGGKMQDEWQAGLVKEGSLCIFVFAMAAGLLGLLDKASSR